MMSDPEPRSAEGSAPAAGAAAQPAWTVRKVLEWTTQHLQKHGSETPRLDAEVLLAHARKCRRIGLYTDYDQPLSDAVRAQMRELVQRRANAEPVAYLVGHREFFSLDFAVTADVLIPRPDTETLVLEVISLVKGKAGARVLDLCTGSGCIAISVAKNCGAVKVTATDVSAAALAVARKNVETHQVGDRVELVSGDLFAAVPAGATFDVIASNPPYIPAAEIETLAGDVRRHEPRLALDGGGDGLDLLRRILAEGPRHLVPGGWLLVEFSPEQSARLCELARGVSEYDEVRVQNDLAGQARVLLARRK